ncbi:MAG: hypothetical protein A2901_09645 [Elusimicrobia bacterium RIFCSPLOWO2_01_FULL_54_10]|nr:MAG: hypothetical protein A2901_09645 [Elusimicrobia bacterium RIFCSPLOWO2_01_FULL_54_10]
MKFRLKSTKLMRGALLFVAAAMPAFPAISESYEELELTSRNLVLPETEQFRLGAKLFQEKDKKLAAWKAFQTFLYNYPESTLTGDAQFMLGEAIFHQAITELKSGNAPDEMAWRKDHKGGLKMMGKGLRKSLEGLKNLGNTISGDSGAPQESRQIDVATFSEAIDQFRKVLDDHKKAGLNDTALLRIAECFYNIGDYPSALEHFKKIQKEYPQSYLTGESILGAAQCYIPGGDFGSAELELKKLTTTYPSYQDNPQVRFILGIIRYQEGNFEEAVKYLSPLNTDEAIFYCSQSLVKLKKFVSATAKFKKITDDFKDSRFAEQSAFLMGDAFLQSQNYTGAIQEFRKFLKNYPQSAFKEAALYRIAASHFLKQDYSAARESFNLFLNSYPSGEYASLARYMVAETYRFSGLLKEASFAYGQVMSLLPNAPITANAKFRLAWVTYQQKNYASAADLFQKFIDWHPFHAWVPHAYYLMGNCYSVIGKYEQAANDYQQAFDKSPKTELGEAAMALLNRVRYSQGSYGQLTSGYTYILKSLPPSESKWRAYSQLYLADSYYRQKLYREAISVFESIVTLYPNQTVAVQARDGLSWCHFQMGNFDEAQKQRQQISEVRLPEGVNAPAMTSSDYELANALFNQKKYMEALEAYEKFIRQSPDSPSVPEAIYRTGLCYYRQEYYTQAIDTWEGLAVKYPNHERTEEAIFQIADTYFRAQKYDKAVETYRRVLARYPNNKGIAEAYLRIGQSYYNAGDDKSALTELDAFLRKYPNDPKASATLDLVEASLDRAGAAAVERGIKLMRDLIDAFPRSATASECQFRIARRFFNAKNYASAVVEFEKLATEYSDSTHLGEAQFYAAESYYSLKKFSDAASAFQRFISNFPASEFVPAAMFHLGTSQFNLQNQDTAIESYRTLVQQFPDSEFASAALNNMALAQKKLLRLSDAADTYSKLALTYPSDPFAKEALFEVGKIKRDLKQYGEAILVLKDLEPKLAAGDERKLESLAIIAECYNANNDADEALKILKQLSAKTSAGSPWKLEALRQMGDIFEKRQSWAEAVAVYEEGGRFSSNPQVAASFRQRAKYLRDNHLGAGSKTKPPKTTGGQQ